ncbi:Hypothetical protein HVR_LOCUS1171 [uncultured virus]|nr:Hypothetical protein HVR_LOCUS1171 [uncultured virus]
MITPIGDKTRIEGENLTDGDNFYEENVIYVKPLRIPLFDHMSRHILLYYPSTVLRPFPLDPYLYLMNRMKNGLPLID